MITWIRPKRNWDFFYHVGGILTIVELTKLSSPATRAFLSRWGFVLRDAYVTSLLRGTSGANGNCAAAYWDMAWKPRPTCPAEGQGPGVWGIIVSQKNLSPSLGWGILQRCSLNTGSLEQRISIYAWLYKRKLLFTDYIMFMLQSS